MNDQSKMTSHQKKVASINPHSKKQKEDSKPKKAKPLKIKRMSGAKSGYQIEEDNMYKISGNKSYK